ncbi:PH domain-containing protein [Pedococcus bigeumensis]|uniref:PH domain-containing protein n=1 Tax=Pedococcus bigeumensis TaxID=433644 RepID=UPI002FED9491
MGPTPSRGEIDRYLVDGERIVFAVHQHWGRVAEPVGSAVVGLVLAFWVDARIDPSLGTLSSILWWAWFAVVARAAWKVVNWRHDWFIATDKRLLLFHGFITRRVPMMPLTKVTDMAYERSVPGRIFGYGRFVLESAGQDQALHKVTFVPDPDHHYRVICSEIFGVGDRRDLFDDPFEGPFDETDDWDEPPPGGGHPGGSLPDPYAGWDDPRHSPAAPTSPAPGGQGSLYRSPDLRARDRSADTGPIPIRPRRRDVGHD